MTSNESTLNAHQPFQVNLQAVVELLSTNIYSQPAVFLRELIQNGRDAIAARAEVQDFRVEDGRIIITPTGVDHSELVVRDNGLGMMREEMASLLSTVGQSSKRDLFDLPRTDRLGQFGIGLLSCFMVTDTIIVETRPAEGGAPSRWIGYSDGTFTLENIEDAEADSVSVGTTVRFTPRPEDRELTGYRSVYELAARYAEFLPGTMEVNGPRGTDKYVGRQVFFDTGLTTTVSGEVLGEVPAGLDNALDFAVADELERLMGYGTEVCGSEPLAVIALDIPETGTKGTAFVLSHAPSPGSRQATRAYLGGLLVSESLTDLLPDWAFFVRVVLNTTGLTPTASREGFVANDSLAITKGRIAEQIRAWILTLAEQDQIGLQRFLATHDLALRSLAKHDTELAAIILPYLTFETSRGRMMLGEAIAKNPVVRYTHSTEEFRQIAGVLPPDQLVINAGYVYEAELMRMIPGTFPQATARPIQLGDVIAQFDPVRSEDRERANALENLATTALFGLDCNAQVRAFTPEDVPALYVVDPHLLRTIEMRRLEQNTDGFWGNLLRDLTAPENTAHAHADPEADPETGIPPGDFATLVLNWRSPIIRLLAGTEDHVVVSRTLRLLYVQAILAGHNPLRPADRALLNESLSDMVALSTNLMKSDISIEDFLGDS